MLMQPSKRTSLFSSSALRSFVTYCKPYRWKILFVFALFVVSNLVIAIQPVLLGKLVDQIGRTPIDQNTAWFWAIALIGTGTLHNLTWRGGEFAYRGLLQRISFGYESRLFREVIRQPYPYFVDKFTGKISSYITLISSEFRGLLSNALFDYTSSLVTIITVVMVMTSINLPTGLIVTVALGTMLVVGRYTLAKDMHYQAVEADINSTKNGHITDAIANFASVKAFHKERREIRAVESQQDTTYQASMRSFFWGIMFWGSMSVFVRDLMWPAIVGFNLWLLLHGHITLGEFTTVISTALLFTNSIWQAVWGVAQVGQRIARIEEAHVYLFGRTTIAAHRTANDQSAKTVSFNHEFVIQDMTFAYPDKPDTTVLHGVTLHIRRGEKIGIVGVSGSGKSTLVKLLLDHYDTTEGTFLFDDRVVSSRDVSRHIAYVPQDTTLFHRSVADNIAYAVDHAVTRQEIIRAATLAQAHDFIMKLTDGYDTLVGERGVKLSGGQRQRIAIARLILNRAAELLVLDEATSALDSESEAHIQKALRNLWRDKTVLVIAHRLSTLNDMDYICVMHEGRIAEFGTRNQLIEQNGIYATLLKHQTGGFISDDSLA